MILDLPARPLGDTTIVPSRVADHRSAAEIKLLRAMLGLEGIERLDGEFVTRRIDEIIATAAAEATGKDAKLCLAVRLGSGSRLSEAIRIASDNEVEIADEQQQVRFIVDDLGKQAQLVAVKELSDLNPRYALLGRMLTYRLAPYRQPGSAETAGLYNALY